jgi:hypothetical protein
VPTVSNIVPVPGSVVDKDAEISFSLEGLLTEDSTPNVELADKNDGVTTGGTLFTVSFDPGDATVGGFFYFVRVSQLLGVRFYTAKAGAHSIRVSVWRAGSRILDATKAVAGPGAFEHRLVTPVSIPEAELYKLHTVSMYETGATGSTSISPSPLDRGWGISGNLFSVRQADRYSNFAAGDAEPTQTSFAANNMYPVDPIVQAL